MSGRAAIRAALVAALLPIAFASDCAGAAARSSEPGPEMGKPFTLQMGERASLDGGKLSVTFVSVAEDSRCPKGEQCVWAGNARVVLEVSVSSAAAQSLSLDTNRGETEAEIDRYTLKLEGLAPEPVAQKPLRPENYRVTLSVR